VIFTTPKSAGATDELATDALDIDELDLDELGLDELDLDELGSDELDLDELDTDDGPQKPELQEDWVLRLDADERLLAEVLLGAELDDTGTATLV